VEQTAKKTTAIKSTEAAKKVRLMVGNMYRRAHEAKDQGRPVAYVMGSCLVEEMARAMGIELVYTENYAGLCAAKRQTDRFLEKSCIEGYPNHLCGYARNGLGFDAMRKELGEMPPDSPDGGMPMPDMLICSSQACDTRYKWYQALGRYMEAPVYCLDVLNPPKDADVRKVKEGYVTYQVEELKGLVEFLERQAGKKMDWEKLDHHIDIADETQRIWWEVNELRKAIPSPMPTADHANIMFPPSFMLGTQEALDFIKEVYHEVRYRVDNRIGVIPGEKYRLLWGLGLPPFHSLRIMNYFQEYGGVLCIEYIYRPWLPAAFMDIPKGTHPLERLARRFYGQWTEWHDRSQRGCGDPIAQTILDWIESYKIDGIVEHQTFSCRFWGTGQIHVLNVIKEHKEVPILFLTGDIIDITSYSDAETRVNIQAFMEVVDAHKKKKESAEVR